MRCSFVGFVLVWMIVCYDLIWFVVSCMWFCWISFAVSCLCDIVCLGVVNSVAFGMVCCVWVVVWCCWFMVIDCGVASVGWWVWGGICYALIICRLIMRSWVCLIGFGLFVWFCGYCVACFV